MNNVVALYLAGYVVSVIVAVGWNFAYFQGRYSLISADSVREDLGFSLLWSVVSMLLWPVMLPALYLMTGFARYGWRVS